MELVGKLVGVGTEGFDNVLHTSQVLCQFRHFGPVTKDSNGPLYLTFVQKGETVRNDRNVRNGFQTDIVLCFSSPHDPWDRRLWINLTERAAYRFDLVDL